MKEQLNHKLKFIDIMNDFVRTCMKAWVGIGYETKLELDKTSNQINDTLEDELYYE